MTIDKNQQVAVIDKKTPAGRKKTQAPAKSVTMEQVFMEAIRMPDLNPANLEKLIELRERLEAKEAEKAFNLAMARFRAACPVIEKKTDGATNQAKTEVLWKFASLGDIDKEIRKPASENGLSWSWDSEDITRGDKPAKKTICTITHELGHSIQRTFTSVIDTGTSAMNAIHKESSTVEVGRRQSLKLALGIVIAGEDDDAISAMDKKNGKAVETITKAQTKLLEKQIGTADETLYNAILTEYNVTELYKIPADKLADCKERITTYKKAKREREKAKVEKEGKQTSMEIAT